MDKSNINFQDMWWIKIEDRFQDNESNIDMNIFFDMIRLFSLTLNDKSIYISPQRGTDIF